MIHTGHMHVILIKCPKSFGKLSSLSTLRTFLVNLKKKYVPSIFGHVSYTVLISLQFRERYKNHKVPLDNIGSKKSSFVKTLHAAGSRILEIHQQSEELALTKNVRFEQDIPQPPLSSADVISRENAMDPDLDLLASLNEETLNDDDDEADADTRLLAGKFVDFTDLLPPLPAKGNFKVEAIKASQYFFS